MVLRIGLEITGKSVASIVGGLEKAGTGCNSAVTLGFLFVQKIGQQN